MPLHLALVLSIALHLAAYALADWAGLNAPPPPAPRPPLEALLILPEIMVEPPAEAAGDEMPPQPPHADPPPEPSPAAAAAPAVFREQTEAKPAAKSPRPELFYPLEAVRRGLEGEVLVAVTLDARGRVLAVRLERGSGHGLLDEAALRAARSLKFVPAGAGETILPVVFKLR